MKNSEDPKKEIEITPQTYIDMNREFREQNLSFSISVPTQEQIDYWKIKTSPHIVDYPTRNLIQEMWDEIGGRPNE